MLKKYYLQLILMIILIAAAGFCIDALGDYGRSQGTNIADGHDRPPASGPIQRPAEPLHNRQINPPDHAANQGGPSPAARPTPGAPSSPGLQNRGNANNSGQSSIIPLLIYTAAFLLFSSLFYYLQARGKIRLSSQKAGLLLLAILVLGLLMRLYLSTLIEGHSGDLGFFRNWASAAAGGLSSFYSNSRCDYPPLYIYVLWLLGKANSVAILHPYSTILLKLPSILADLVTAGLIYRWGRRYLAAEISVLLAAFYIFNPAVFINSTLWGQVDSFFTLIIIMAIWALSRLKTSLASALFAAAILMKPQGIIFLPVLAFELIRQKNLKTILKAAVWALITAAIIILPFAWQQGMGWIVNLFTGTIGEYPYASVNAFNLFYLLGANYVPDNQVPFLMSWHNWGMLFIVLTTAGCWGAYARGNSLKLASAAALLLIAGVFILGPSMHERYLFPATALAVMTFIFLQDKRFLLLAGGFTITVFINTGTVLLGSLPFAATIISALNVALLAYLAWLVYDTAKKQRLIKELFQ